MIADTKLQLELEKYFTKSNTPARVRDLLLGLFTEKERIEFARRIEIVKRLKKGQSQHKIANALGVGVSTVTRASREIKLNRFKYL